MIGFVLAGTHSGVGKTTLTAGIMRGLMGRGHSVQAFKSGPDYIDPAFHCFVTRKPSINLDAWMLSEETLQYLFAKHAAPVEVAVVEGVMGLYDGFSTQKDTGSTAHLSKMLKLPVILIIDGSGMSASAAALVKGFQVYDPDVNLAGVIVNKVSGAYHYELLKEAIERDTGIPCLGYMPKNKDIQLESRHLGLIPAGEVQDLETRMTILVDHLRETIDFEGLEQVCCLPKMEVLPDPFEGQEGRFKDLHVAVAKDQAFNFYYEDNFQLMEAFGATITTFSPLNNEPVPPNTDLVYIGGGFPEVFASQLSQNTLTQDSLKAYVASGKALYAECGGLMYLTQAIVDLEGHRFPMTGIFEGDSVMTGSLKRFGYVEIESSAGHFHGVGTFKAHEFHRSEIRASNTPMSHQVFKKKDTALEKSWQCGYCVQGALGAYGHVHFYNHPSQLEALFTYARQLKEKHHGNR